MRGGGGGGSLWPVDPSLLRQVRSALVPYLAEVSSLELLHLGELELVLAGAQRASEAGGPLVLPLRLCPPRLPRTD